jgi:hypothetical protein
VSAALNALIIAGGVLLGRLVARAVRPRGSARTPDPPRPEASVDPFAAFPCTLGDVIVRRAERDEAWLAGALLFAEDRPVAALFVAPEAGGDRAIFVREGTRDLVWLAPLPAAVSAPAGEPPHTIEHRGARYERRRRLPVRVEVHGTGVPAVGSRAVIAEYAGPGADAIVLVVGTDATRAWQGGTLAEEHYDILPGGTGTL